MVLGCAIHFLVFTQLSIHLFDQAAQTQTLSVYEITAFLVDETTNDTTHLGFINIRRNMKALVPEKTAYRAIHPVLKMMNSLGRLADKAATYCPGRPPQHK